MIKPDLIIIWPFAYDYPVCRQLICENRRRFNQVIVSFTYNDVSRDYRKFLKSTHPDWTFVDNGGSENWYDGAVNSALDVVNSKYVMFLEQDFLFTKKILLDSLRLAEERDFICLAEGERLHLAFCITTMELVNKTTRYFQAIDRYHLDCFDLFCAEMLVKSSDWSMLCGKNNKHLNGLTQNLRLAIENRYDLIYKPDEFKKYIERCLGCGVNIRKDWLEITTKINEYYQD